MCYVKRASILFFFLLCSFVSAEEPSIYKSQNVTVSLLSPERGVQPEVGIPVGIHFKIAPEWHVYAENPGDIGLPTKVLWNFSPSGSVVKSHWSLPKQIEVDGKTSFVYEDEFWVLATVIPGSELGKTFSIAVDISWGECKNICIPEFAHLVLTLPNAKEEQDPSLTAIFANLQSIGEQETADPFMWILLLAFIGGIILNIMPCVLPVISLKVLNLLEHAGRKIFLHNMIFSVGILLTFWALAGLLMLFQHYGHDVGWGFQFQEPLFVAFLAAILLVFSLNLLGVFEMGVSLTGVRAKGQMGYWGSFFNGLLATVVSTPCTGPFLGTVVGLSFILTPLKTFLVFTSMGIGLASPYILLGLFPQFLRYFPKPGRWMLTFKQLMGFLLLATVMWLIWVYQSQVASMSLLVLLISFVGIGIACWIYGCWGFTKRGARWVALLLFVISCVTFVVNTGKEKADDWLPYSEEALEKFTLEGKSVFLEFTAKWCLICQANGAVLASDRIESFFKEHGIIKMRADWTQEDPKITKALGAYGRRGVPLYILYTPNNDYKVLPQLLTPNVIEEAFDVH